MTNLKGKSIIVTGGRGFLGDFVTSLLHQTHANFASVSRRSGYDLRNEAEVLSVGLLAKPDIIIHLASPLPDERQPASNFSDTLQMGSNVIHLAALSKAFLVMVSDYSKNTSDSIESAKSALFEMCRFYAFQYGLSSATLRFPSLYGVSPFGSKGIVSQLFSTISAASFNKEGAGEFGLAVNGENRIPLLHALDAASLIVKVCQTGLSGKKAVYIPPHDHTVTYSVLVEKISKAAGYSGKINMHGSQKEYQPSEVFINGELFKKLEWKPSISIDDGIQEEASFQNQISGVAAS